MDKNASYIVEQTMNEHFTDGYNWEQQICNRDKTRIVLTGPLKINSPNSPKISEKKSLVSDNRLICPSPGKQTAQCYQQIKSYSSQSDQQVQ